VGSLKVNTALEYSTRVVQEGGRRCKKSTLNDLVHLTPLRIPLMNPPIGGFCKLFSFFMVVNGRFRTSEESYRKVFLKYVNISQRQKV
jgi:hypothetical protein